MKRVALLFAVAVLALASAAGHAQSAEPSQTSVLTAGVNSSGRIAVNLSAGHANAQSNQAAIASGGGHASVDLAGSQSALIPGLFPTGPQRSEIGGDAFRGASGIISVNQASGHANTQANVVGIAAAQVAEVSLQQLGQVAASIPDASSAPAAAGGREQKAAIADSAFAGARGLVQINQLAGSGNRTMNVFALSVGTGAQ